MNFLFLSVLLGSAIAAEYRVGQEVDAAQGGKFYRAKIEKVGTCLTVKYDDGSQGMQVAEWVGPKGQGAEGAGKAKGTVGEEVDVKWMDGNWYGGTLTGTTACFQVSYQGWGPENNEWVDASRLFAKGTKAKGDTSQAAEKAQAAKAHEAQQAEIRKSQPKPGTWGPQGDFTNKAGVYYSAEQIRVCRGLGTNEWGCRSSGYNCTFDFSKGICGINDRD